MTNTAVFHTNSTLFGKNDSMVTTAVNDHNATLHNASWLVVFQLIVLSILFITAVVGNILVCWLIARKPEMRTVTGIFLVNLALSDLGVAFTGIPMSMATYIDHAILHSKSTCTFNAFCLVLFFITSINTLTAISIHKYITVVHSMRLILTKKRSYYVIGIVWLISLLLAIGPIFGWSKYIYLEGRHQCSPAAPDNLSASSHLITMLLFGYILPVSTMLYCYTRIYIVTRKHIKRFKRTTMKGSPVTSEAHIINTLVIVLLVFMLCWLPFLVYISFAIAQAHIQYFLPVLAFTFGYGNSALNPIIYALRHKTFRRGFKDIIFIFLRTRRKRHPQGAANSIYRDSIDLWNNGLDPALDIIKDIGIRDHPRSATVLEFSMTQDFKDAFEKEKRKRRKTTSEIPTLAQLMDVPGTSRKSCDTVDCSKNIQNGENIAQTAKYRSKSLDNGQIGNIGHEHSSVSNQCGNKTIKKNSTVKFVCDKKDDVFSRKSGSFHISPRNTDVLNTKGRSKSLGYINPALVIQNGETQRSPEKKVVPHANEVLDNHDNETIMHSSSKDGSRKGSVSSDGASFPGILKVIRFVESRDHTFDKISQVQNRAEQVDRQNTTLGNLPSERLHIHRCVEYIYDIYVVLEPTYTEIDLYGSNPCICKVTMSSRWTDTVLNPTGHPVATKSTESNDMIDIDPKDLPSYMMRFVKLELLS